MPNTKLYCEWCHGTRGVMKIYLPETPVLEWMEEKIILNDENFVGKDLTEWEEWEILTYDEMVKSIRRGTVCKKCWDKDQKLYDKYYDSGDEEDYIRLL